MNDFAGKVAVITGAGSGFGREFARVAAARGMKLVVADIQADALETTRIELEARKSSHVCWMFPIVHKSKHSPLRRWKFSAVCIWCSTMRVSLHQDWYGKAAYAIGNGRWA